MVCSENSSWAGLGGMLATGFRQARERLLFLYSEVSVPRELHNV